MSTVTKQNLSAHRSTNEMYKRTKEMGLETVFDRYEALPAAKPTGTAPNTSLLNGSGVRVNSGIPVNDLIQTNIENIYAAGDVAETVDAVTGDRMLTPIWPNAMAQGKTAGSNMAGVRKFYSSQIALQNAVEFREVPAVAMGITCPPENSSYEILTYYQPSRKLYRKLVLHNNVAVGAILVGDIKQAGLIGALIKKKTPLGEELKDLFLFGRAALRALPEAGS